MASKYYTEGGEDGLKIYQQLVLSTVEGQDDQKKCYRLFHRLQTNGTEIYQQPVSDLYTEEGKEGLKV